ncbi:amidohydrolase [Arthrobacter sp. Br18]|uniref:amidohydrolase n=1 Tax=Arthrobacter sp. Br18 TaxID=1312954 RepID=UPI00047A5463|nr:amidohydrolase [Arthrobacter sp. Br18]
MSADWVFHSGRIFDGYRILPGVTAVAVRAGRITAVGTDGEVRAAIGAARQSVNLAGRLLIPGFTDAHNHAAMGGVERKTCDLTPATSAAETLAIVAEYVRSSPPSGGGPASQHQASQHQASPPRADPPPAQTDPAWLTGGGWYKGHYPGGFPGAEMLDAVVPHRPVYLINRDHHSAWVNTCALQVAGIGAETPDPADGRIERHPDGTPTGILHEGAMDLVSRLLPPVTPAAMRTGILEAQRYLHSVGVTGWQEAILGDYAGYPDASPAYRKLSADGRLTGRATGALWVPRTTTAAGVGALVEEFSERRRVNAEAGFRSTSAKIMVDGVPENRTAAMLDPYCGPEAAARPAPQDSRNPAPGRGADAGSASCACSRNVGSSSDRGLLFLPQDVLAPLATELTAAGFDLHLHVIGDRAVRSALDAVDQSRRAALCAPLVEAPSAGAQTDAAHIAGAPLVDASPAWEPRHQMAHLQLVHPEDIARFGALTITANLQALWACNDDQMLGLTVPLIGGERNEWQYPFAALERAGAPLAMGSDWPISSPDPWQAIHVAVNRSHPAHPDAGPLVADQALTLQSALRAYTSGSAYVNRLDDGGVIAPGALADIVVLDVDPFGLHPADLHTVRADLTMVGGVVVHDAAAT